MAKKHRFSGTLKDLARRGPLLNVGITVGDELERFRRENGFEPLVPAQSMALIDTGAQWSTIPTSIAIALGIPHIDERLSMDFSGTVHSYLVYPIKFILPGGKLLAEVSALGTGASQLREFQCLIGRDVLAPMNFWYRGPEKRYGMNLE